jgi:hypothetical protein
LGRIFARGCRPPNRNWSASTAHRSFQTVHLRASVISQFMNMGKMVTRSKADATDRADAENCFDPSTRLRVQRSSTSPAAMQNSAACLSRIASLSHFGLQRRPHIQILKSLVHIQDDLGFGFEELNRQTQESEPPVTVRKQRTVPCSDRQKTQKCRSELLPLFLPPKARSFSLDSMLALRTEVSWP